MKYSVLYALFFIMAIGSCKKNSSPETSPNTLSNGSPNTSDTISHVLTGGWSFQINGGSILSGVVTTCLMSEGSLNSPYQLIMGGPVANNWYSVSLVMDMPSTVPVVGNYIANLSTNNQFQINYEHADNSFTFYSPDSIVFNVVSYDQTTRAVSCSFSGNVNDGFGNISSITNGAITGVIQ